MAGLEGEANVEASASAEDVIEYVSDYDLAHESGIEIADITSLFDAQNGIRYLYYLHIAKTYDIFCINNQNIS